MQQTTKRGRPRAIPPEHWATVFLLYSQGKGYRRIADRLADMRLCYPTKSTVERCIKGQPPYQGRRVLPSQGANGGGPAQGVEAAR